MGSATYNEPTPRSRQPEDLKRVQCEEEDEPKDGVEDEEVDEGWGGERGRGRAGWR